MSARGFGVAEIPPLLITKKKNDGSTITVDSTTAGYSFREADGGAVAQAVPAAARGYYRSSGGTAWRQTAAWRIRRRRVEGAIRQDLVEWWISTYPKWEAGENQPSTLTMEPVRYMPSRRPRWWGMGAFYRSKATKVYIRWGQCLGGWWRRRCPKGQSSPPAGAGMQEVRDVGGWRESNNRCTGAIRANGGVGGTGGSANTNDLRCWRRLGWRRRWSGGGVVALFHKGSTPTTGALR
jgi:hypothetical protein